MTVKEVEDRVRGIRHMKKSGSKEAVIHLLVIRLLADVIRVIRWKEGTRGTTRALCDAALEMLNPEEPTAH